MSHDRIELRGLRVFGRHGVYAHETADGQYFVIDAVLQLPLESALRTDDVAATVHYGELAERIAAIVGGEPVQLIETLAGRIADAVLEDSRVDTVQITVHKPSAPIAAEFSDVSVTVARSHAHRAVVALGGNLGDRMATLESAVRAVAEVPGVSVLAQSPVVESAALTSSGVDDAEPRYLNQVVLLRTSRAPLDLLVALQRIEAAHGRVRAERWGNRTLDLDLVSYDAVTDSLPGLDLPHPRAGQRAFVLVPWALVDPDAVLPGQGRVAELAAAVAGEVTVVPR